MADHDAEPHVSLAVADANLDAAWQAGVGLNDALAIARRTRIEVGSDPMVEEAKMLLAERFCCSPSAAYAFLVWNSGEAGLAQFSHDVMTDNANVSLPD